ncbi:ABC transporter ATP-binding protein [Candidatus Harpocratesius sp.]
MIKISNFTFQYNSSSNPILTNINLKIKSGEFVLLLGSSGSGKSTLLRALNGLIPHFFGGIYKGEISIDDKNPIQHPPNQLAQKIGYIFQNPDNQLLMEKVLSELIFGLENLGFSRDVIKDRVKYHINQFNLDPILNQKTYNLSGGQKQIVALASILAMSPKILLLDEPTSELDPFARDHFLQNLFNLHATQQYTIIMIEHNIEHVIDYIDRIIYLEHGKIIFDGIPKQFFNQFAENSMIPTTSLIKLAYQIKKYKNRNNNYWKNEYLPFNRQQFSSEFSDFFLTRKEKVLFNFQNPLKNKQDCDDSTNYRLKVKNLELSYTLTNPLLQNISFSGCSHEIICIMGKNGCGKTTLLKSIAGLIQPSNGTIKIRIDKKENASDFQSTSQISLVFQNPSIQFYRDSVYEELDAQLLPFCNSKIERDKRIENILDFFDLKQLKLKYPRYLSLGEQQRLALGCALITEPAILLLDEPTHGMDQKQKTRLLQYIGKIKEKGCLILIATHDLKLVSSIASKILYLDDKKIKWQGIPQEILPYYTPFTTEINSAMNLIFQQPTPFLTVENVIEVFMDDVKECFEQNVMDVL